jgi:hypothetical protein
MILKLLKLVLNRTNMEKNVRYEKDAPYCQLSSGMPFPLFDYTI